MYDLLSLLVGVVIAVMVTVNGCLTAQYGVFHAAVIIHIVGGLLVAAGIGGKILMEHIRLPREWK